MTSFLRFALVAFAACGCGLPAAVAAQPVTVNDAWVRAPAPGQKVAAAYMELTSRVNLALVSVASPAAAAVELHNTAVDGGVMKMRPVGRIELPAGKPVKLAPGGAARHAGGPQAAVEGGGQGAADADRAALR